MMRIDIVTLFPELVMSVGRYGVTGRAVQSGMLTLQAHNPRDFTDDPHRTVDDRPYGGGPGMLMKVGPLQRAIAKARNSLPAATVIYMSPQGRRFDQSMAGELAQLPGLILVAGRYEGIDERLIELECDREISIGDYVLSGGELAAMILIDTVARLQPGALGDEHSAQQDSFSDGLLEGAQYTRPEVAAGIRVPEVLLSGDHAAISSWRRKQSLGRTALRRPDLLEYYELSDTDRALLDSYLQEIQLVSDGKHGKQ
jgi:tRNA (guanine37-N1)-methyltransferase